MEQIFASPQFADAVEQLIEGRPMTQRSPFVFLVKVAGATSPTDSGPAAAEPALQAGQSADKGDLGRHPQLEEPEGCARPGVATAES